MQARDSRSTVQTPALVVTASLFAQLVACAGSPPAAPLRPPPPAANEAASRPALPPGILARADGVQGLIQVEEHDGLRLLTIAGVVHAAVPVSGAARGIDPVVQLITTVRPGARTALVIGLGSGKTAADLAAAGLTVEVVELEPAVIQFARSYFGYRGHAEAGDGLDYLAHLDRSSTSPTAESPEPSTPRGNYDVVLMDAFAGTEPPPQLITGEALAAMRLHTSLDGVTVIRGLGRPDDPKLERLAHSLATPLSEERRFAFVHAFGSGVGDETQNLYFLSAHRPLDFTNAPPLPMWPLVDRDELPDFALVRPGDEPATEVEGATRRVTVIGYVHVLAEDSALALDLPHWEMGAIRYLLTGAAANSLRSRLPAGFAYPTQGDIGSDGDPSTTLHEVLGGGGAKRSDVRMSPVIAQITGTARLRALVHPDSRYIGRDRDPAGVKPATVEPRLPYGGALYELEVEAVTWTLDRAGWRALDQQLRPLIDHAARKLRLGQLGAASGALREYLAAIEAQLPASLPPLAQMKRLAARVDAEASSAPPATDPFARAAACDRVRHEVRGDVIAGAVRTLREALLGCAEDGYRKAADLRSRNRRARVAAGRLLALWDAELYGGDDARTARLERELVKLRRRYPDLDEILDPPTPEPTPEPTPTPTPQGDQP